MIYLAILLILCGLLILITALSVEKGIISPEGDFLPGSNKTGRSYSDKSQAGDLEPDDVEIIFPGNMIDDKSFDEDIFISFDDETDDSDRNPGKSIIDTGVRHNVREERRKIDSTGRPEIIEKRAGSSLYQKEDSGLVSAVMFDDRSNIIDYESGSGVIDSTFSKYKSIKRIGKGRIESDHDGVNFYLDDKLYRFDFHKVYDIWSGSNYVALPLKGNSTVKLFIIENSAGFPEQVEADFKEYEKGL